MRKSNAVILTTIVTLFFGVFFLFPVLMVIGEAFVDKDGGFTCDYLAQIFVNPVYLEGLWLSLIHI